MQLICAFLFIYFVCAWDSTTAFSDCFNCPDNEVLYECKSPCQPTCQQPFVPPCYTFACQPGCDCKAGYIRDEVTSKCILPSCCPPQCGENEVPNNGKNDCEKTCQDSALKVECVVQNGRCVCKPGLVRDLNSGKCLVLKHCPNGCGKNAEWSWCTNPTCQKTCQNRFSSKRACAAICKPGCQCKTDHIWDEETKTCVLEKDCPKAHCGVNEEWKACSDVNSPCRKTCANIDSPLKCTPPPCKPGCSCKAGFVWDEQQRKCVNKQDCTKPCGPNESWKECSNVNCRESCQRRKPKVCTKMCLRGCSCKSGYIWDEHYNKCVLRWQCSKVCGKNEEWCDFIPDDTPTCQTLSGSQDPSPVKPELVSLRPGCMCKDGYIWDEQTSCCVTLENCPGAVKTTKVPVPTTTECPDTN